jgi:predicted DNA-binding transcriptional regulator AlpA
MTKILKKKDVAKSLGISCPTVDRWSEETRQGLNDFPLAFTQRGQIQRWTADAIEEWIVRRQSLQPGTNIPATQHAKVAKKEQCRRQEATEKGLARHGLGRNQKGREEA